MPMKLTRPSAVAATAGAKPISMRYFVWCTCTAYQAISPVTKPRKTHQKRPVRTARPRVQSTAAHAGSTTLSARRSPGR